jgi:hypothetical protein
MNTVLNNEAIKTIDNEAIEVAVIGKPIVKLPKKELIAKVYKLDRSKIVTVHLRTFPTLLKKNRQTGEPAKYKTGEVVKLARQNCLVGVNYQNCVNNQLDRENKESNFVAEKAPWGKKVEDTRSLEYWVNAQKEFNLYVAFNVRKVLFSKYVDLQNNEIPKSELVDFLPLPKKDSGRQGTDTAILWIKPKVDSIIGIATDNVFYEIVD